MDVKWIIMTYLFIAFRKYLNFFSEYIDDLPLVNSPGVFGLNPNAEIGYYTQASKMIWGHLVEMQPQSGELLLRY